jgi:hypothetical protein
MPDELPELIVRELETLHDIFRVSLKEDMLKQHMNQIARGHSHLLPILKSFIPEERLTLLMMLLVSIAVGLNTCFGNSISRIEFGEETKEFLENLVVPNSNQDRSERRRDYQERRGPLESGVEEI